MYNITLTSERCLTETYVDLISRRLTVLYFKMYIQLYAKNYYLYMMPFLLNKCIYFDAVYRFLTLRFLW